MIDAARDTDVVCSADHLTRRLIEHFSQAKSAEAKPTQVAPVAGTARKRTAIFAVHGISPQQRYAFQDQVATSLQSYLNATEALRRFPDDPQKAGASDRPWKVVVHWPQVAPSATTATLRPSALRVYKGSAPDADDAEVFDVYEGYWSPLSKGKTNVASALGWLLRSTFLPTSSTAAVPASIGKAFWDVGYVVAVLTAGLVALALGVLAAIAALKGIALVTGAAKVPQFWDFVSAPISVVAALPGRAWLVIAVAVLFGYLVCQLIVALRVGAARDRRTTELKRDAEPRSSASTFMQGVIRATQFHRGTLAILGAGVLAIGFLEYDLARLQTLAHPEYTWRYVEYALLVVLAIAFFQFARYVGDKGVTDVLGDIQIYTTHDANSAYYAIRQQIIGAVTDALLGVLQSQPTYDAVHIFGHSLGSTIALDVVIALEKMIKERQLSQEQWERVRSFTTFGTALEKTKFFFDVRQPTISASQDQWQNDVYGSLFTCDADKWRRAGSWRAIFWTNLWYFRDAVANGIVSYQSDVEAGAGDFSWKEDAGPHDICADYQLTHRRPITAWVHSDYLTDPLFWEVVAPIVTA